MRCSMKFLNWLWKQGKPVFHAETSDRETIDISRELTPRKVDAIMRAANGGDIRDQCRLANELIEHNIDIAQAVSTRVNAVLGCHWSFEPGDDSPEAEEAAEKLETQLRNLDGSDIDNFDELLEDLMGALLPGFAISEILWKNGGSIAGFHRIDQKHFTFVDGFVPRLVTSEHPNGVEIRPEAVLYHRTRFHGSDPVRGGLIRPLAWIHCFNNGTEKNLLSFMERYGMPFLVVRVDESTWQKERYNIKDLIRNFGSSGGGLFSKGTEQELLQAANTEGNIYFRIKEKLESSIEKLILGQTASSGDGGGLSNNGAQDKVRRDILESDCRRLQRTINAQLCSPWTRFNYGSRVTPPRFTIDCAAPEDKLATAQIIQALSGAGGEPDWNEMSERFGIKLSKRETPAAQIGQPAFHDFNRTSELRNFSDENPLSDSLERWFRPVPEYAKKFAELSDDEFDKACREHRMPNFGKSDVIEKLFENDMKRAYGNKNES